MWSDMKIWERENKNVTIQSEKHVIKGIEVILEFWEIIFATFWNFKRVYGKNFKDVGKLFPSKILHKIDPRRGRASKWINHH